MYQNGYDAYSDEDVVPPGHAILEMPSRTPPDPVRTARCSALSSLPYPWCHFDDAWTTTKLWLMSLNFPLEGRVS